MDINQAVAKAIAAERAIAGLTVRQLSDRSAIPLSTLMRILGAEREIKVSQVDRLAAVFGVYPHEIVERAEVIMGRGALPAGSVTPLRSVPAGVACESDVIAASDSPLSAELAALEEEP